MMDVLLILLKVGASVATAASLLELGLQLEFQQALAGMRKPRFVTWSLLWGVALGPALAWVIPRVTNRTTTSLVYVGETSR